MRRWERRHFLPFLANEAVRAVVEGGEVGFFWQVLRQNEAMGAVVEDEEVFIPCHFWHNEAVGAVAEDGRRHFRTEKAVYCEYHRHSPHAKFLGRYVAEGWADWLDWLVGLAGRAG